MAFRPSPNPGWQDHVLYCDGSSDANVPPSAICPAVPVNVAISPLVLDVGPVDIPAPDPASVLLLVTVEAVAAIGTCPAVMPDSPDDVCGFCNHHRALGPRFKIAVAEVEISLAAIAAPVGPTIVIAPSPFRLMVGVVVELLCAGMILIVSPNDNPNP